MIQIDMEMPKSCRECKFRRFKMPTIVYFKEVEKINCALTLSDVAGYGKTRHHKCPLQEVKE